MNNNIKLVWNFSGNDALEIARHHLKHIEEYVLLENIPLVKKGSKKINEFSAISYIVVTQNFLTKVKNDLKPHEGFHCR